MCFGSVHYHPTCWRFLRILLLENGWFSDLPSGLNGRVRQQCLARRSPIDAF